MHETMAGQPWPLFVAHVVRAANLDAQARGNEELEDESVTEQNSNKRNHVGTAKRGSRTSMEERTLDEHQEMNNNVSPERESFGLSSEEEEEEDKRPRAKMSSTMFTSSEVERMKLVRRPEDEDIRPEVDELTFRIIGEETDMVYEFPRMRDRSSWYGELWLAIENQKRLLQYSRSLERDVKKLQLRMVAREKAEGRGKAAAVSDEEFKQIKNAIERHMFRTRKFILVS